LAARARRWLYGARRSGMAVALRETLISRANRAGMSIVAAAWPRRRRGVELRKFGTEYHGWQLPVEAMRHGGVCYCVGVGEDVSLEDDLLRHTAARIWSFDPTRRAIAHVGRQRFDPSRFCFVPTAVWDHEGTVQLYVHPDNSCDTYSPTNLWRTTTAVQAPCTTVRALMRTLGHERLRLLKLNIGGGEWRVLEDVLKASVPIDVLCVEFCQPASFLRIGRMMAKLNGRGFQFCRRERWKFTFLSKRAS
jgi:FkbM family methyltransferase